MGRTGPKTKVPLIFAHVRVSVTSDVGMVEELRDDLVKLLARYAEVYAVRVKRRRITSEQAASLMTVYEQRLTSGRDVAANLGKRRAKRGD